MIFHITVMLYYGAIVSLLGQEIYETGIDKMKSKCLQDVSLLEMLIRNQHLELNKQQEIVTEQQQRIDDLENRLSKLEQNVAEEYSEYVLMFLQISYSLPLHELIISSASNSSVDVYAAFDNCTKSFKVSSDTIHMNYTRTFGAYDNTVEKKGIYVKSSSKIYVHTLSNVNGCCSTDGYTAIPVQLLGTEYIVVSISFGFRNYIGIVAVRDNTSVRFDLKVSEPLYYNGHTYNNGDKLNINLNRFETFQLACKQNNESRTNMKVSGNKPFATYSGNECGHVNDKDCSYMVESIAPVSTWGTVYIVPHLQFVYSEYGYIKITTKRPTVISITGSSNKTFSVNSAFMDSINLKNATIVQGNSAFLLTYYVSLNGFGNGNLMMVNVPSTCQYSNNYIITSPKLKRYNNFISVIIESRYKKELLFNETRLSEINIHSSSFTFAGVSWLSLNVQIPDGSHTLRHPDKTITFGVIQYGYLYKLDHGSSIDCFGFPVYADLSTNGSYCIPLS